MKKIILGLMVGVFLANFVIGEEIKQVKFAWLKLGGSEGKNKPFKAKIGDANFKISTKNGLPSNQVTAVAKLPGGGYVFGTKHGLCLWQDGELTTFTGPEYVAAQRRELRSNSNLPHNDIADLMVDSEGALWVATGRGICRIKDGQWEVLKIKSAQTGKKHDPMSRMVDMNLNDIQELFLTSKNEVIFGSRNAGVFIYNPKSKEISTIYCDKDS
jgi:two component regulator with propeller domain